MYSLSLRIDQVPDNNANARKHWRKIHKENKYWDELIFHLTHGKRPDKPCQRVQISIERHASKMMDYDGLVNSMKPVVDALVSAGILIDDSWKVTGPWMVTQCPRPKKVGLPYLQVYVTELPIENA